jgi:hypothetical protein
MQDFLQKWAAAVGASQSLTEVTAANTSAFDELALVYNSDINQPRSRLGIPRHAGPLRRPERLRPLSCRGRVQPAHDLLPDRLRIRRR